MANGRYAVNARVAHRGIIYRRWLWGATPLIYFDRLSSSGVGYARVFPLQEADQAHRVMEESDFFGKVALRGVGTGLQRPQL